MTVLRIILTAVKRATCKHRGSTGSQVLERSLCHCNRCGADWWAKPGYLPGNLGLDKFKRNEAGWPLNPDGSKMAIRG